MKKFLAFVAVVILASSCNKGGPAMPASTVETSPGLPGEAVLTLVSGETGAPVEGAVVVLAGDEYRTDAQGRVVLKRPVQAGAPLGVWAPGFLDRETVVRPGEDRLTLWPKTSASGMDEDYTERLVYHCGGVGCQPGADPLKRVLTDQVWIVPSPEIRGDAAALQSHERAATLITAATRGQVTFAVVPSARSGVVVETRIDPSDPDILALAAAAVTRRTLGSHANIDHVTITIRSVELARRMPLMLHELGHAFGLSHSPERQEIMWAGPELYDRRDLSVRESLTMGLMLQRRAGNRFPDSDVSAGAASAGETSVIACGAR